jgi:EAL domain-containing protein (putative c-di-GMP-specific phosphodiesterase class I)
LRIFAKRFSTWAGPFNQVSHLGGAKFAFALSGDGTELAERVDALTGCVSEQFLLESGAPQTLHARIGIASHQAGSAALAVTLMDAADTAASTISRTVPHTTVLEYSADLLTRSRSIVELQGALDLDEGCGALTAYYQPQVDFANGRVIGLEALARWQHPTQGLLMPAHFIKLAETSGKIYQLDNVVLTQVCRHLREWLDAGLEPVPVSFNYSRSSLLHRDVLKDFRDTLERFGIPAHLLELEITETELLENLVTISERVDQFRTLGVRIAVDDFGTGYSNLDALNSFPFDRLKVDRQFVVGVANSARVAGLFHLIQGIAVLFNAELLCEGVENAGDVQWLAQHGACQVQGMYFSPARSSAEIVRILTTLRERPGDAAPLDAEQLRALLMQA